MYIAVQGLVHRRVCRQTRVFGETLRVILWSNARGRYGLFKRFSFSNESIAFRAEFFHMFIPQLQPPRHCVNSAGHWRITGAGSTHNATWFEVPVLGEPDTEEGDAETNGEYFEKISVFLRAP